MPTGAAYGAVLFAGGDPGPIVASLANVPELLEVGQPFFAQALCRSAGGAGTAARDEREAALLHCIDEVAVGRGAVPTAVEARMHAAFDGATVVELLTMAGCTLLLNRYCSVLRLPVAPATLAQLRARPDSTRGSSRNGRHKRRQDAIRDGRMGARLWL